MKDIIIGKRKIGINHPPFVVAEMSGNHNQSLKRALKIIDAAADAGCHALKIQTYTADTMTIDCKRKEFFIKDKTSLWKGTYLYQLYLKAYTPWEWHEPIIKRCRELGMICFSTPFDETALEFLEGLKMPAYKIASFENTHIPLIKKVAKTKKPLIISTGMASVKELTETVKAARAADCRDLILLKCTSSYPSSPKEANIKTISDLAKKFKCLVGISDHTLGCGVSLAAVSLGACMIEKHFTLKRKDGGVDSAFSMEPEEMKVLVEESQKAFDALGKIHYGLTIKEKKSARFKRSIFAVCDIKKGEKLSKENIRIIRPGNGLAPREYPKVLGRKAKKNIARGTPLKGEMVD